MIHFGSPLTFNMPMYDNNMVDKQPITHDRVNHPQHYTSDPSGVECIEITRHRNFNVGNGIKYLWRAGLKDSASHAGIGKHIEDLQKAIWYIEDEIDRLQAIDHSLTNS